MVNWGLITLLIGVTTPLIASIGPSLYEFQNSRKRGFCSNEQSLSSEHSLK